MNKTILFAAALLAVSPAASMPICGYGKRVTCVVDGDTFWLNRVKYRLMDIDAPEVKGRCGRERRLAKDATKALQAFLSNGTLNLHTNGLDIYGRTLVWVSVNGRDASQYIKSKGLAHDYPDHKGWCR